MMKKFTHGFLACLFAIVSTATFAQQSSAYAYAPTYTPTGASGMKLNAPGKATGDVTPDVRQSIKEALKKSTNRIYFESNVGQFNNPDVMYGFRTNFGSMGVYHNKLRIVSNQKDKEEVEKEGDNHVEEEAPEHHIVDVTFPGSPNNWTVEPGSKSSCIGSYFRNGKAIHPDLYNEITLKNVYPGVDLRLYSGEAGSLEFDWLVSKASDYEKIKLNMNGQDGLVIEKEGNLLIKLHDIDMKMVIPETYQIVDGNKNILKTRMEKIDDKTLCYKIAGKVEPNLPLVIDPVMIWSSFMMNNSTTFDEYLYAVASNSAGEVYCAGMADQQLSAAYMSGVGAGFDGTYSGTSTGNTTSTTATAEGIIYRFNAAGTAVLSWSYTGITGITNNGQTNPLPLVPTDLDIFPNGRVLVSYSQDLIQIYSNTLAAQFYSGSVQFSGTKPTNANYQSVCIVDDATFYVSGVTTTAYPSIVPNTAPDPTFAGTNEGIIMRITNVNSSPVQPTASWGTYVGGSSTEGFASIALSNDHTKLAFAVHTVVGTGYPGTTANAVDATPGAAGSTELLVGVLAVSATPQTTFSMFSYLGGSGDEGRLSDAPQSDKAVICADNNFFYVGGNTYSNDIPGRSTGVQPNITAGGSIDQFISRISWSGTATGFASTYNGGSGVDLVGGIAVDFRSNDVLLFGTTGTSNTATVPFPVLQTTPASPYYQNTFGGGTWDICYGSFSNDLSVRSFGTYIGGSANDYLGSTGVLRGTGHLFYNLTTGLINIGTTIHSNETSVPVQWITNIPGFDKTGGTGNDNHFIFEWDPNTFDYGDAPSTYEQGHPARSALSVKLRLGATIDAESAALNSTAATGDDTNNSGSADDEDGVSVVPMLTTGATSYSVSVSVFNNTGATIKLAGWLDANNNHIFDLTEFASVSVPSSASQQTITLPFSGLVPVVYGTGNTFLRLRLSDGNLTSLSDTGEVQAGEVEDYQICIKPDAGTDKTVCLVGTATMSATGSGTWTALAGNPGTSTIASPTSPTTNISGFSVVGTYRYLWTNSTGCSDTAAIVVTTQPGTVTITPSTADVCVGSSITLTASASPSGGTFQWSPLVSITPANGVGAAVSVSPGTTQVYTVVYTLGGCNSSANRTVTVYPVVTAEAGPNQTYCSNVSTPISLGGSPTASGGSGNFTYAWSPPTRLSATNVANPSITSVVTSTTKYFVTVTDNLTGCSSVDSMTLTINPAVTVSIAASDTDLCLGQVTTLAATGTPAGGSYSWSPTIGMTPAAGNTASVSVGPSANQTYTVVYSLAGCTNSAARTVNVYPNVQANAGVDQTYCLPVTGTVTLGGSPTANGGSGAFTYNWSPSTRLSATNVANPTVTSFVASTITYYVTVTDTRSGCTSVDSMVLTINSQATVSVSSPDTNLCAGQSATLTATGLPTGGTYQWSPLSNMTPGAGNTATVTVAPPVGSQTYNVTYTIAGCSGISHKTVNVVSNVVAHSGGDQTYCMPYAPTITLGAAQTATGGSGSYSYNWSPATRLSATNVANPTLTSNVASTIKYFVTVTDNVSGCTSVDSMTLTLNPAVIANAGSSSSVCNGSSITIGGTPAGSGGTGTLTYAWSPGTGLSAINVANPTASPTTNTTYTLTVTDSKLCSATSSVSITVNPKPTADAGPLQTLTDCSAASVSIGGTPTATGGTPGYTYSWSPTGGLDNPAASNPNVSHIASNTTYTVQVTDAKGCTAVASVKVNVTTSTMQVDAGVNASYCANSGGSATFNGTLTGGTGPFTFAWTPIANLTPTNAINTIANPQTAGAYVYTLNVTDANGCNASDTVRLDVWPAVVASAGPAVAVCNGFGDTIGGNPTASGGTGPFVYSWSPATGLNSSAVANPIATPLSNTPYTVVVTDAHSCTASSTVNVTVNSNPVAHAGADQSICLPVTSTVRLGASPSATGGTGSYTYLWSPATNLSSTTAANPTVTVTGATSLEYYLIVTDANTGCTSLDSTHLTILAQPTLSVSSADTDICSGQSAVLTASGSPAGGTYQWAPLVNIVPGAGNTASVTVSPTATQTYQVIYFQGSCSDTAYQTVRVFSSPVASAGPNETFCLPVTGTITLGGSPTASAGSGIYRYNWSPATNLSSTTVANPTITAAVAGTTIYTVTVTDTVSGCTDVSQMTLTINPTATVAITPGDTDLCSGQSTTLTAVGTPLGGSYQWSPTFNMNPGLGNTASVIVAPSGTQRYSVTYTANGCAATTSVLVNVYTPVVAHAGIDQAFCLPYAPNIFLGSSSAATGGSGNYSYHWSPGANLSDSTAPNPIVSKVNMNVEYHLTVTDNVTGCQATDSTKIVIDTHATISIATTDTNLCFGQSTVLTAVVNPTGGTYQWAPIIYLNPGTGNTQSVTVSPVSDQVYQLVYTRNGCRDTAYQDVHVYPVVVAHSGGDQTYCLPVSGSVTLGALNTATGGSGSYTYTWYPNVNLNDTTLANPSLTSIVAGTRKYYVRVTDNVTGCTAVDSMTLTLSPQVTVTASSPKTNICLTESAILTATGTPSGGNYQWNPIIAMTPANGNSQIVAVSPASGSQTYFVYYDLNGCRDTASITVTAYPQPVANAGGNQSFCLPAPSIVRVGQPATGGSGNFIYRWSPGVNVNDSTIARPRVDSLTRAGSVTYTVTVTDLVTGCTSVDSAVITLIPKPTVTITASDTNLCAGQTATLTANAVPSGGSYHWTPSGFFTPPAGNTQTITTTPISNDVVYSVVYGTFTTFVNEDGDTITQATGCADTAFQTIHVYPLVFAHAGGNQAFCLPVTGGITLGNNPAATGGSGHYIYTWSPGTGLSDSTAANPTVADTAVMNTVYHLTVTDSISGCTSTDSARIIINPTSTVSISSADTNLCVGQNTTLTAVGAPPGGTYLWTPNAFITPSGANTASISVNPPSTITYTVTYTLANCSATATKTVNVYSSPVANAGPDKSFCAPDTSVVIGQTATGGSGSYTYLWTSNPAGFNSTSATPTVVPTVATTTYYVVVTDAVSGCTSIDSVVVVKHNAPPVDAGPDQGICIGTTTQLLASGAQSYQWSPVVHMNPASGSSPLVFVKPDTSTTYTVVGTDQFGCVASDTVRVTISPRLVVHVAPVTLCFGDTAHLVPNLIGPNYTYSWTPGTGLTCVTCASPLASPPVGNTVYTVTITDSITGCSGSDTVAVVVHSLPNSAFQAETKCVGERVQFTDRSTSTDPIASYFYNFGDTTTFADTSHLRNPVYIYNTFAVRDAYQIVTTIYGCSDSSHVAVSSFPVVHANAGPDTAIAIGGSVVMSANGGTTYQWDNTRPGLSTYTGAAPTASPLVTTTYVVTVTNDFGCTDVDSVTVTVLSLPDVNAGPDTFVCAGNPMVLQGFSKTHNVTFSWSPILGLDSPNKAQPTVILNFPGVYQYVLKVTYFSNGIFVSAYDTMYLTVNPTPVITASPDSVNVCSGNAYQVNFNSSLGSTTYAWTASNGTSGTGNVPLTTVINNGTTDSLIYYTVIGTVPGGCSDTIRVPVVVKPIPTLVVDSFPADQCSGVNYVAAVHSTIPGATVSWSSTLGPNGTGGNVNLALNNPSNTTPLTVIFTYIANYNGCASPAVYDTVVVNPLPHADAGPDNTIPACSTDSIQIGGAPTASFGTGPYTYSWTPTAGITGYADSSNPFVRHLGANTSYSVTVTDSKGCTATDAMNVIVTPPTLAITLSTNGPTTWCEGSGGSVDFTVNVTGGLAPFSYLWTPSAFLSDTFSQVVTASPDVAGTYPYTVLVTDASGCQASKSKNVVVKPLPHPVITGLNSHYCASAPQVPLTATIAGGTFSGAGVVNTGSGYVFRPSQVGPGNYSITYTVTVSGCTHDTSQIVTVDSLPGTTISTNGNVTTFCSLDTPTTFIGTPAGGTWSGPGIDPVTGVFTPSSVAIPNNISRIVTIRYRTLTSGGCTDSASINITINKSLTLTITASADTVCQGSATVLTPHYPALPVLNTIQWYDVDGSLITVNPNAITVHPTRQTHGYYAVISTTQGCTFNDTIYIHTNQPPIAHDDYDSTCLNTPFTFDVRANDVDSEGNVSTVRVLSVVHGTATVVSNNISYVPVYGFHGLDTVTYQICNVQCTGDCDTGRAYVYVCPRNLPPTADTINYTAFQNQPHDVNVLLATSDPNGDPLTISLVGTYSPTLTVTQTGNGAYTITGTAIGTFPIVYQVCDTDQYPINVLCDTAVIFANIIPVNILVNHPPVANNDYATTTGIQPAIVNVRGNDTDPDGNPLSVPAITGSGVTAHGHFTVNLDGTVTFQPNGALAQGIYYDTISYCIFDITTIAPQPLTSCALLIVTTNVIDTPANRPPLAVDDHVTVAQNTSSTINVKSNDSDPDGDALGTPAILTPTTTAAGTITSVSSNGDVVYTPNTGVHSINGQPVDSFIYRVCDTLAIHGPSPLCDTAKVYVYINPMNLPPTADTIRYTALVNAAHDVNVLLAVSDPNSDPLTITAGPFTGNFNYTQTGNGAYTITSSAIGTFVIPYQVCDTDQYPVHVLCATSVIIATIIPDTASPLPPYANNDYATTTGTTPAVINARGNDGSPMGNPLTTPVLLTSATTTNGTWSVDGTGNVVFTPNAGLSIGIHYDSVRYQVCDVVHPALCATAWVIVTTNVVDTPVANRPPLAVDDHLTVAQNSTNNALNVKANDSDPDGNPLTTPVIIAGVVNGTITAVATNGDVTYTPVLYLHSINGQPVDSFKYMICDSGAAHSPAPLCDTAEAYIYVQGFNLPPVANNIYLSTPENTPLGVNVASGAYDPNGDPLTYTYPGGTGTTQGGNVVVTGNGSVNYFPPTGFIGVDSFAYSVCDTSPYPVHVLCDTAYVVVNVTNPADSLVNHPPVATDDHVSTAPAASININVVANDNDPDGNPITVTVVAPTTTSLGGTVSIGINNTVNYTAPATVADSIVTDTFSYVICDSSAHPVTHLCDTALVFVIINKFDTNIIHTNRPPVAADDFTTLCEEEYSILNVLANDIDPNGDPLTVTSIITPPTHGLAAVSSPSVVYLPALYFHGQDSLQYQVCDNRTPRLCDTAWVHYTVNLINHRPLAAQDTATTNMQTSVNIAVTTNDFEPDNDSIVLAIVTPPLHGTAVQVGNTYTYTPAAGYSGEDTFYYRACDVMNPTAVYCASYTQLCDVGMVSIHVTHNPPHIPPTYDTIPQNSPPVTICPAVVGANGNSVHVASFPCGPNNGTVGFATSDSCLTYVPNHDFTGDDSVCVVVCDNVVPTLCDTNKVYIHVTPSCIPPVAVNDTFTVLRTAGTVTLNVTANDTNHTTGPLAVSVLTQPTPLGIAVVSGTNIRLTVGGTVGQAQFLYSICSTNPACTACDTGIVYINVTGTPSTPPVAVDDSARTPQDSTVCVRVVANDIPGTNPITVTSVCAPAHGTNAIAPNGFVCYTPAHGYYGNDDFCYVICDNSVPALCDTAIVHITVTPNPHPPVANTDFATTPQGVPVVINVPGNDTDPDGDLNTATVTLITTPNHGNVTGVDPVTGAVTYVSIPTYVGADTFQYRICDATPVALGGPLCDTATVFVNVTLLNHPPHAPDTTVTIPQDSFIVVCPAFSDPDAGQSVTVGGVCTPNHGTAVITGTSCVSYTPSASFFGVDSFCYVVCDDGIPTLCDTGIVTVVVTHVAHCPVANGDFANGDSLGVVINELINDQYVGTIGNGYSVQIISGPDPGNTAVVNANGTITYTAGAGYRGVDHIVYRVNDSLDRCNDTAVITIFVVDTCVGPIAQNDRDTVCEGAILSANVQANDYPGNAGNDTLIVTYGGSHGFAYLNTRSGAIEYVAAPYFHGLDTVNYQICSTCPGGGPTLCSSAQLVVDVLITNHAPVAVDDTATMIEDHSDTINVVANDYDIDGDPLTVSISAQPTFGKLRLWNNQLIYTPNPNFCGTDTFGYQITGLNGSPLCPGQRAWDLGLVFVNVTCVNDTPVIPDTLVHVPEDSIITFCVPYTDPDAGDHHTISVLCAPTHGVWVSAPAVTDTPALVCMTYKPDTNFYGIDHACIILCDNASPALCDTSFITIVVDPRNEPPVVQDQNVSTPKGVPVGINISTGAFDPNADPLTYIYPAGSGPHHGTWTPDAHINGTGVYTPNDPACPPIGGTCSDSFTVVVCDNSPYFVNVLCDTATMYVTVYDTTGLPNHPPVANTDYAVTDTTHGIIVYVAANDLDPDGDQLGTPRIVPGATSHGVIGYNASNQVVYSPVGPFTTPITVDSFEYSICDTNAVHPVSGLCDTAWAYITINYLDSSTIHHNQAPVAVDDNAPTHYGQPVTVPVLHNDSDPNGDPIHVTTTALPGDSVAQDGTVVINADGSITYTPNVGPGRGPNANDPDTFYYVICDTSLYVPTSLCDTARVIVTVPNSVQAVNDTTLTGNHVAVTVNVKSNDYDPELDSFYVVGTLQGPGLGTAVLTDTVRGIYTYTPNNTVCTGDRVDSFSYIIQDTLGARDTAWVYVHVKCCSVVANDDNYNIYQGDTLVAGVLGNDLLDPTIPHHITFSNTSALHGTVTVRNDSVIFRPDSGYCGIALFSYVVSDTCGRDTANVSINITCANIHPPVAVNDTVGLCINHDTLINVLVNDFDIDSNAIRVDTFSTGIHGTVTLQSGSLHYTPLTNYTGRDSFMYRVCDNGVPVLCDTGIVYIDIHKCSPPIIVDSIIHDTTTVCTPITITIDSIYQGPGYVIHFAGVCDSTDHGVIALDTTTTTGVYGTLTLTYTPDCDTIGGTSPFIGNDTACLIICNTGIDTSCATVHVVITVLPKPPVDSIWANNDVAYTCVTADTIDVLHNDGFVPNPGNSQTGTAITVTAVGANAGLAPSNGTVAILGNQVVYTPDPTFQGTDTFKYAIEDNGMIKQRDTATVYVYVCIIPPPVAVDDNQSCMDTTSLVNTPGIINVLANDTLFPAMDTIVTIASNPSHGQVVVNPDFTVTFTPDSGFHGNDNFTYSLCESVGPLTSCDTASVCINVIDTVTPCFFPNGFSPNGDGVNDVFTFPCNDKFPNANIKIFNRWGDVVYESVGAYKNDWSGTNMQGSALPDGTYYFIYQYNDGSGKSEARFVVLHR